MTDAELAKDTWKQLVALARAEYSLRPDKTANIPSTSQTAVEIISSALTSTRQEVEAQTWEQAAQVAEMYCTGPLGATKPCGTFNACMGCEMATTLRRHGKTDVSLP